LLITSSLYIDVKEQGFTLVLLLLMEVIGIHSQHFLPQS